MAKSFWLLGVVALFGIAVQPAGAQPANWSGIYVGAHGGYGWGKSKWTLIAVNPPGLLEDRTLPGQGVRHDIDGWQAGIQAGLNVQSGRWVFGIEPSLSFGDIDGSSLSTVGPADNIDSTDVQQLLLITGRAGYDLNGLLPFFRAGYVNAKARTRIFDNVGAQQGSAVETVRHNGYTVGGGLEYMLTRHITVGAEYNFLDLGTSKHGRTGTDGSIIDDDVKFHIHRVIARVNVLFNWPFNK